MELADLGAADSCGFEFGGVEFAGVVFGDAPAYVFCAVF